MPVRSREYHISPLLNTKSGRLLVNLIPDFFQKTPDSTTSQIVKAIGGLVEQHANLNYHEASAAFTNYFGLFAHPYVWYANMPLDRFRDITVTSHLESRDERDFLRTAAIGHMNSVTNMLTPTQVTMTDPDKFIFHIEHADKVYNRRLSILDDDSDLWKSTITSTPIRISSVGQLSTTTTDPYIETISAVGTPALQVASSGSGTPLDDTGELTEKIYALHSGGFYEVSGGEIVPNTITVHDANGVIVASGQYSISANRITPVVAGGNGDINLTPISVTYIPKRLATASSLFSYDGNSLQMLQAGTLTVTNVFRDEIINSGKSVKIEVVSPTIPKMESTKVVFSGTTFLGEHVGPEESTFTDIIASIERGEVIDSYIITLHSDSVNSGWQIDAGTPSATTDFTVTDLSLAMSASVRNELNDDLFVIIDDKLSIYESFPLKRKELLLEAGQAVFSGSTVSGAPSIASTLYLYLDGVLYEIDGSTIKDLDGNTITIVENAYSYAYMALELDLVTMYSKSGYNFEDMAVYQDTLIFLVRKTSDSTTQLMYVDINTLKEVSTSAVEPIDDTDFLAFSTTFNKTHLKSITCTDYGTLLMLWNNTTTAVTEHFLEYDVCYYNSETEQIDFPFISNADFAFTENGSATSITRANMSYDIIRHPVDEKASIYTALKDGERESMRERPHFSSGFTVLDMYNSYLKKKSYPENTTEQGLVNAVSRITRNTTYDISPKITNIKLPEYTSIDDVWLVDTATNTAYSISEQTSVVPTGTGGNSFTASSFFAAFATPVDNGFLVKAEFKEVTLNTAIANRESSVYEGIILASGSGGFVVQERGLIAREIAGRIVIEITTPVPVLPLTVYYIGVQSDIVDNFSGTRYTDVIGKVFNAQIPFNGLSVLVDTGPEVTTTYLEDLGRVNHEAAITGGSDVAYFPYNYGILLNVTVPEDFELHIDYTQLIDGYSISKRFYGGSSNNTMTARPSDYVEVAVS